MPRRFIGFCVFLSAALTCCANDAELDSGSSATDGTSPVSASRPDQRSSERDVLSAPSEAAGPSEPSRTDSNAAPAHIETSSDVTFVQTLDELIAASDLVAIARVGERVDLAPNGADEMAAHLLHWDVERPLLGTPEPDAQLVTFGLNDQSDSLRSTLASGGSVGVSDGSLGALQPGTYLLFLARTRFPGFGDRAPLYGPAAGVQSVFVVDGGSVRPLSTDEVLASQGFGPTDDVRVEMPPSVGGLHDSLSETERAIVASTSFAPREDSSNNADIVVQVTSKDGSTVDVKLSGGAANDTVYAVVCHVGARVLNDCAIGGAVSILLDAKGAGVARLTRPDAPFGEPADACEQRACAVMVGYPDETLFAEVPL